MEKIKSKSKRKRLEKQRRKQERRSQNIPSEEERTRYSDIIIGQTVRQMILKHRREERGSAS